MSTQRIFGGQTKPGATDWQQFGDPAAGDSGIFVDVDTSSGNFSTTPIYLASLGGSNDHWTVTGTSSIYNATPYGFSGSRNEESNQRLLDAIKRGTWGAVQSLRRESHEPSDTCWLHGDNFCLSTLPVATASSAPD